MREQMPSTFAHALRDRVSAAFLELEERELLTRKHVQYATGLESSQVRRIFIGEQPLTLAGYVAIRGDTEIPLAARETIRSAVEAGIPGADPERISEAPESAIDMVAKSTTALRNVMQAMRDKIITNGEAATIRASLADVVAEAQQLLATVDGNTASRGPRSVAG